MESKPFFLLLLLPLVLAGCIWGQARPQPVGLGVTIKEVLVEPPILESGTKGYITLIVKNTGGVKASDVVPELLGLPRNGEKGGFTITGPTPASVPTLLPPPPEGGEAYFRWELTAPTKAVDVTYNFMVGIKYGYSTEAEATLRLVNINYYRALPPAEREALKYGVISQMHTAGPLRVTIEAPQLLVAVERVPVWVKVENVGGGRVVEKIAIATKGDVKGCPTEVELILGQYVALNCYIEPGAFEKFKDFSIALKLDYTYYLSKGLTVMVRKAYPL